jgi:hypothetical protein
MREEKRMEINTKIADGIVIKTGETEIAIAERNENSTSPIIKEFWIKCPARVMRKKSERR